MGLIYIGQGEGSQIIQLFGRCVRLKGKNYSLKREPEEIRQKEKWLDLLQTAFIFGIGSDYLNKFLEAINKEVPEEKELIIKTILNNPDKWNKKLLTIENEEVDLSNEIIEINYDSKIASKVKISLIPKLQELKGLDKKELLNFEKNYSRYLSDLSDLLNWTDIYKSLTDYKIQTGRKNIVFSLKLLKDIIKKAEYKIYSKEFEINSLEDIEKAQDLAVRVLKAYIDKYYSKLKTKKEKETLKPSFITEEHPNIIKEIKVKIPVEIYEKHKEDFELLENALNFDKDNDLIPFLVLDPHLYNPIPFEKKADEIKTTPVKLNEGETRFIKELREFLKNKNEKVYLVRNLPKVGVGFYDGEGYYPDFILWYLKENTQHIAFIDPKGLRFYENRIEDNHKLYFNVVKTKIYEKLLNEKLREKGIDLKIKLYGFFISTSESVKIYSNLSFQFKREV